MGRFLSAVYIYMSIYLCLSIYLSIYLYINKYIYMYSETRQTISLESSSSSRGRPRVSPKDRKRPVFGIFSPPSIYIYVYLPIYLSIYLYIYIYKPHRNRHLLQEVDRGPFSPPSIYIYVYTYLYISIYLYLSI